MAKITTFKKWNGTKWEDLIFPYSHTHTFESLDSKPNTLEGYGITDAHITNGLITIGNNSIRPITSLNGYAKLTDIPSLSGYATEQWVTNQGYLKSISWDDVLDKPTIPSLDGYATKNFVQNVDESIRSDVSSTYETKANAITGLSVSGTIITYTKGNGTTGTITTTDTNTRRAIQVDGTQILSSTSTTALDLKAGNNVSLSNSGGAVTINATDTTYEVASSTAAGLMSKEDKTNLDILSKLLVEEDESYVDTIAELLSVFETYPEGTNIATLLAGKQPLDSDLTAIAGLSDTSKGFLKKTGSGVWALDDNIYLTTSSASSTYLGKNETALLAQGFSGGAKGSGTQPVYINASGTPVACTYTLGKSVPSDAKFTDTNTTYSLSKDGSTIILTGSDGSKTSVTDSNNTYTLSSFEVSATATELNYVKGVTSSIQTQITDTRGLIQDLDQSLATVAKSGSYSDLAGKPTSLQNPNAINLKVNSETSNFISYDGSAAKTITIKPSTTNGAFIISDGTTNKTIQLAGKFTDTNTQYSAGDGISLSGTTFSNSGVRSVTQDSSNGHKLTFNVGGVNNVITIPDNNTNYYHTPTYSSGLSIASGTGRDALYVPIATSSALGVVKSSTTGTTANRDYKVQINTDGTMKVNVPWNNTNTTYEFAATTGGFIATPSSGTAQTVTIPEATEEAHGLMSVEDKTNLNTLVRLLTEEESSTTIDTITEVLNAFAGISEGTTVANALAGKQNKVSKLGSTSKPVYVSADGTFAEASTYAGGTAVTLNGSGKGGSTASFYAPTGAGTYGYILKSNGSGAPTWVAQSTLSVGSATKATQDGSGNTITATYALKNSLNNYLPLAGGTMTGPISFNGEDSLPSKTLSYICGVDAFASGGQMGWQSKADFLSGYATQSWVEGKKYLTSHQTVSNSAPTLSWGTTSTIGTIGGTALTVKMPANPNTDTHHTAYNYVGAADKASNAATTNGNTYLKLYENGTKRSQFKITGSGATTVVSDANGNITISSTDNNTTYESKAAASGGTAVSLVTTGEKYTWNNKTYTTTIAASTGTSKITLAHGKTYAITAGGTSFVFTMPTDNNTVYSLPLAASGTRGGIQIGYSASGANIPVKLSSEKAYVELTSTAITTALGYTPPTSDTNTWRPVVNNLTSTATDSSLSAAQGKALNDKFANYQPKGTYITPTTGSEYYPKYIQTRTSPKTGWYGTEYPLYAWWETNNICKLTVDNYSTKVDMATKDASGNVITSTYATKSEIPTSLPASDVYSWAKASTKPSYTASEVGALSTSGGTVNGNLILKSESGNSPKLSFQRGDNTGTLTDWNMVVESGNLKFNTVSASGSTAETLVATFGYDGSFNATTLKENGTSLSNKYFPKANIKVDGTSVSTLDLRGGTNVTLTKNSDGTVSINSTASGGSGLTEGGSLTKATIDDFYCRYINDSTSTSSYVTTADLIECVKAYNNGELGGSASLPSSPTFYRVDSTYFYATSGTISSLNTNSLAIGGIELDDYILDVVACLMEGTLVTMADGSSKPIEEVKEGDLLMSYDFETGKKTTTVCLGTRVGDYKPYYYCLMFDNGFRIKTNWTHDIYNATKGTWTNTDQELELDDEVLTENNGKAKFIGRLEAIGTPNGRKVHFYDIMTSNNCYYADGVLFSHTPTKQAGWVSRHKDAPIELINLITSYKNETHRETDLMQKDEYVNKYLDTMHSMLMKESKLRTLKDNLSRTDYITLKVSEGIEITDTMQEILDSRKAWRKEFNEVEAELSYVYKTANDLKVKYSDIGEDVLLDSMGLRKKFFLESCKKGNANLNKFKEFYRNSDKFQVDY